MWTGKENKMTKNCVVCATTYDATDPTDEVSWGLCAEHQTLKDEGYIAFVGVNRDKTEGEMNFDNVHRTGDVVHLSRKAYDQIIEMPCPPGNVLFCGEDTIALLTRMNAQLREDNNEPLH